MGTFHVKGPYRKRYGKMIQRLYVMTRKHLLHGYCIQIRSLTHGIWAHALILVEVDKIDMEFDTHCDPMRLVQ